MPRQEAPDSIPLAKIKRQLTAGKYEEFNKWMRGQTVPSQHSVYQYDFDRWLRWKRGGPEPAFD